MEEKRVISVNELIKMFVASSYLQEQRIFKFSDIYQYIERCYIKGTEEGCQKDLFPYLIDEAGEAIEDMINEGIITNLYQDGSWGMYHIEDKVNYMELASHDKEYVNDMIKVFLDINGGAPLYVTLVNSKRNQKNR